MNSLRFCLLLSLSLLATSLSAAGIPFFEGSWNEVLAEAKAQRKVVFVDAYTTWCGPCKAMARNTFPDDEVGAFFGEHFISYKYDMEKGEGPQFAAKYAVNAYPTLLFINYKGEVVHKALGYRSPAQLLTEARQAITPEKNQDLLELAYEEGTKDPDKLFHYTLGEYQAGRQYSDAAARYFATQEEKDLLKVERNWKAIETFTTDLESREFQYLLSKQKKFMKRYGIQPVADKLYAVLKQATVSAALTGQEGQFRQVIDIASKDIKDQGQTASSLRMLYAEKKKDWFGYAQRAAHHFDSFIIIQPKALDHAASIFANHVTETDLLIKATEWSRQSVAIENEAYNNFTYARLLHKLADNSEAKKFANKALRIAIMQEGETEEIEAFLKEVEGK
ncbi:MAG: thioredoxin family protein [Bacteroidota bacterium]